MDPIEPIDPENHFFKERPVETSAMDLRNGEFTVDRPNIDVTYMHDRENKIVWLMKLYEFEAYRAAVEMKAEQAWIRRKLKLPADADRFAVYGKLHCWDAHQNGYLRYIVTGKCDDKQGELGRLEANNRAFRLAAEEMKAACYGGDTGRFDRAMDMLMAALATDNSVQITIESENK